MIAYLPVIILVKFYGWVVFANEISVWHGSNHHCLQYHAAVLSLLIISGIRNRLFSIVILHYILNTIQSRHFLIPEWNWREFFFNVQHEFVKPATKESMAVKSSDTRCNKKSMSIFIKLILMRIMKIKSCFIKTISSRISLISIYLSAMISSWNFQPLKV